VQTRVDEHVQADGLGDGDLTQVELRPVVAADAQVDLYSESLSISNSQ
jgi:hypothetical protein